MTATATAARFAAVRQDGRYRVVTTGVGAAAPGRVVATCASKAKAEEKAAKLNAEAAAEWDAAVDEELRAEEAAFEAARVQRETADDAAEAERQARWAEQEALTEAQAATITRDPVGAVADAIRSGHTDFIGTVGELLGGATLDQIAARQAAAAQAAEDAKVAEAIANAVPDGEAVPAEESTKAYRIGKVLREFILSRVTPADSALVAHIVSRNVCYDGTATLRVTFAMASELSGFATELETAALSGEFQAKAPAVMAARAARKSLANLFA